MSFLDDAISTVGRGLAQTAAKSLSDATGFDVGGTLNVLFGNNQSTGGQDLQTLSTNLASDWSGTPVQLQMLQNGVDQQIQMITDLGNQLSSLVSSISAISGEIADLEQMLTKIGQEQLFQSWQTIDASLVPFLSAIQANYTAYGDFIADATATSSKQANDLATNILNTNDGPLDALIAINKFILDDSQARGVLQLWSNMVTPVVKAGALDYRDAIDQYFAYYKKLAYAQLQATNLVMEAWNLTGNTQEAGKVWSQYRQHLLSQEDVFITWLVPLVQAGVESGVLSPVGNTFTSSDACLQLNPGLQRAPGDLSSPPLAYYSPSRVFQAAEALLADLYVTGDADRRIVVHMLFLSLAEISGLVSGVDLTLTPVNGGDAVSAIRSNRLGGPFGPNNLASPPDLNLWAGAGFYIKRFVFRANATDSTLADGSYTITNINGSDGLVPMETYLSQDGDPSFMNDNVLAYTVSIGPTSPFDFMNFMAYMIPVSGPGSSV